MEYGYGNEPEKDTGVPFEPEGGDRAVLARVTREAFVLRRLGGCDNVVRFQKGGGRFKVRLPEGEPLLEKTDFELLGTFRGMRMFRARVWMNCLSDDRQMHDPYIDTVEFAVNEQGQLVCDAQDRVNAQEDLDADREERMREKIRSSIVTLTSAAAISIAVTLSGWAVWSDWKSGETQWQKEHQPQAVPRAPLDPPPSVALDDFELSPSDVSLQRPQYDQEGPR